MADHSRPPLLIYSPTSVRSRLRGFMFGVKCCVKKYMGKSNFEQKRPIFEQRPGRASISYRRVVGVLAVGPRRHRSGRRAHAPTGRSRHGLVPPTNFPVCTDLRVSQFPTSIGRGRRLMPPTQVPGLSCTTALSFAVLS